VPEADFKAQFKSPSDEKEGPTELERRMQTLKQPGQGKQFKWTAESEDLLEEVLIQNSFDFEETAIEFSKLINKNLKQQD